ncbi:MAG TPA: ribosome biogenesis GTPase YlqF [Polyangia bacterium]
MAINWYPGHMATARKAAAESMKKVDLVIEVLDARIPHSSCNPMFEALRRQGQRPALKLLNKADFADPEITRRWLQHYNSLPDVKAVSLCAKRPKEIQRIPGLCQALLPGRGTRLKPLRMMILGIPNVGKSTLMNALMGRHLANVGDEPAITKHQMLHTLGAGMTLMDTPGMLWPGMTQYVSYKLAATHGIGRAAYEDEDVAVHLAGYLVGQYPDLLMKRFGPLPANCDGHGVLETIAKVRCLARKAGGLDMLRAATTLLNEFRGGTLGPISLETVEQVATLVSKPRPDNVAR